LPRNQVQRETYKSTTNVLIPSTPLNGANLIAASDLVISAGGTMNREAAALGVPAATIYAGAWAAVDEALVNEGRLRRISMAEDVAELTLQKKSEIPRHNAREVKREVADLILES
jgi:predicted glycosyltransferase